MRNNHPHSKTRNRTTSLREKILKTKKKTPSQERIPRARDTCRQLLAISECYLNGLLEILIAFLDSEGCDPIQRVGCVRFARQLSCLKRSVASCEDKLLATGSLIFVILTVIDLILSDTSGTFTDQQLVDFGIQVIMFNLCVDLKLDLIGRETALLIKTMLMALPTSPPVTIGQTQEPVPSLSLLLIEPLIKGTVPKELLM